MSGQLGVAVVGLGHWGPNVLRALAGDSRVEIRAVCDAEESRLDKIKASYRHLKTTTRTSDIFGDRSVDAVFLCTPTATHFTLAREALRERKHVFVEKPLAQSTDECAELIALAESAGRRLMVGHVFLFNEGVRYIHRLIQDGSLGEILYAHSSRLNLGPIRQDVNVLWDLAAHDISIFNFWFGSLPTAVSATGQRYLNERLEDVAFVSLRYPLARLVNLHVSWLDPRKVREIVVVGSKQMVVFNDLDPLGPVHVYDKSVAPSRGDLDNHFQTYKMVIQDGQLTIPKLPATEPLSTEVRAFIDWVTGGAAPPAGGAEGLAVVKVLAGAQAALERRESWIAF